MHISKEFAFEASHILTRHRGKCSNLHGHSWVLSVGISGKINPATGFILDYYHLGEIVKPVIEVLDHNHLNWLFRYPSSENICGRLLYQWRNLVSRFDLLSVSLSETRKSLCEVSISVAGEAEALLSPEMGLPSPEEADVYGLVRPSFSQLREVQERWQKALELSDTAIALICQGRP